MKIRSLVTALAASATMAAIATTGLTATAPTASAVTPFDVHTMIEEIDDALAGKAVGYSFAIAHNGKVIYANGRGKARNNADGNLPMGGKSRTDIMSATKNFTAATVLHLLQRAGLEPGDKASPYLPPAFSPHSSWANLTFEQLLTHTSGLGQQPTRLNFTDAEKAQWGTLYGGLKFASSRSIVLDSAYDYTNMNYAILRLTITGLLREVDYYNREDYSWGYTGANSLHYLNQWFFTPFGIDRARCGPINKANAVMAYNHEAKSAAGKYIGLQGQDLDACAGHRGLWVSVLDMTKFRMNLENNPAYAQIRDWQYDLKLGWSTVRDGFAWHGGDYVGTYGLHTCIASFPDNVQAAIMVNTDTSPTACRALVDAFKAATGR